jgi:uncharacterized membrane protein
MNVMSVTAAASLVLWIVLAFVLSLPTGWVHVPLAAGIVLLAMGIVTADTRGGAAPGGRD